MNDILTLPPLENLRSFAIFVESKNIVAAAESLGISQPLLSARLKALDEALGQPLFEYRGRKKVLNAYGREFHEMVKRQLEGLAVDIRRTRLLNETRKHLRIGARKEILDRMISKLEFDGGLEFIPMTGLQIEEALSERKVDIGITQREIDSANLIRKKCFADEFVLCQRSSIRTPMNFDGALDVLKDHRFFDYDRSSIPKSAFAEFGISYDSLVSTSYPDWRVVLDLAAKSGWAIAPESYARERGDLKVISLPDKYRNRLQFYSYYPKEFAKLDWFLDFAEQLQEKPRA